MRVLTPINYPATTEKLSDIRVVIFDVYGTLVNYWKEQFSDGDKKEDELLDAFQKTARYFGFEEFLLKIDPSNKAEKTLKDFYQGLIALNHQKKLKKGLEFPEVKIEEIWEVILMMLARHGYDIKKPGLGAKADLAQCVAYYYNFFALSSGLYDGVIDALQMLRGHNLKLGILSNAQFYTPLDLTLLLRHETNNVIVDYLELFDIDLVYFSYTYGVAKPNSTMIHSLFDALYELQILPNQVVFVGNDLLNDIKIASDAGMHTAFFTGDSRSAFVHDLENKIFPDIVFDRWEDLPQKISFYGEQA
jgi:putative hydrolase of the HAD superfamily